MERMSNLYKWQIEPQDIVFLPGVVTGFNLACHTIGSPKHAVLVQTPVYNPILNAAHNTGIMHQEMELTRMLDGTYETNWDAFEDSFTSETRLFILCNPQNPVGKVYRQDELFCIAEKCLRRKVIICSDEIHCDLVFSGYQHIPIASLDPEIAQNTLTLMAPSKTFNLAGLQCSFAIIQNRELRKRYMKAQEGLVPWVNLLGIIAAQAAYSGGQEWLEQLIAYLEANRNFLIEYINSNLPGIQMGKPQGTYLAWLDCREVGVSENPYKFFIEKGRIAFNDGSTFGRGGEGFVRLNFGCPHPMLQEILNRMNKALEAFHEPPQRYSTRI
jgi:cystathionine beta-lyase